jgi:F-type H+-transporting ATPase subunit a
MRNLLRLMTLLFFILNTLNFQLTAEGIMQNDSTTTNEKTEKGKFNAGEFIFEHIGDAYYWHILTINGRESNHVIAIPLPVVVYSKTSGLNIFISSKFDHGHSIFKNFKIAEEGKNKGKVVEIMPDRTEIKPFDLSITKNVTSLFISVAFILWVFISAANTYQRNPGKAPKGIQSLIEPFIVFIRDDIARPSIGKKRYERYMPYLCTVFFFIWINNMLGLIPIFPGGANVTGNIAVTMVLALFTFTITSFSGNKHYWRELIDAPGVPWWLKFPLPIMPLVEITGVFTKPFSLMIRLFANITAGHVIILGFFSLIFIFGQMNVFLGYGVSPLSVAFVIFIYLLELLVSLIQAYVFTLLSALYFGLATTEHH